MGMADKPPARSAAVERYASRINKPKTPVHENQPKIPNLNMAQAMFDPGKDRAMPIEQIGKQTEAAGNTFLRPSTIAGLAEMKRVTDEKGARAQAQTQAPAQPTPPTVVVSEATPTERVAETLAKESLQTVDDFEYERLLRMATQDILNNDEERLAVEKRVKDIDLDMALLNNEFTQEVPITKGLSVTFRSVTPMEIQSLRVVVREYIAKHPRLANLEEEIYNFMYTVAAVVSVNKVSEASHLVGSNYSIEFDEAAFMKRYESYRRRPAPLIHALIVHAAWFDQRVRKCFQWGALKNG